MGDIDGDGALDLVLGDFTQPTSIYRNTGRIFAQTPSWSSTRLDPIEGIALGDVDGDGELDLVLGNLHQKSALYLNHDGTLDTTAVWSAAHIRSTTDLVLADLDGDGLLDLILGNQEEPCEFYRNLGRGFAAEPAWSAASADSTTCIAVGDVDGDGALDLVCGNHGRHGRPLTLYRNVAGTLERNPIWSSRDTLRAQAVALGDLNGDGRLDLVCATDRQGVRVYLNRGGSFEDVPAWIGSPETLTQNVALGDVDGDGDLDLVVGNYGRSSALYLNDGGIYASTPAWQSGPTDRTYTVALADINGDGALDLICGNAQQSSTLYLNQGITFSPDPIWSSPGGGRITSVALGDVDDDGDLDLAAGNLDAGNAIYRNEGGVFLRDPIWRAARVDRTRSVALGDIDGEGRADLACGNTRGASYYLNGPDGFPSDPDWILDSGDSTTAVALGDVDGDGRLDLVCGITGYYGAKSKLYHNDAGRLGLEPAWISGPSSYTWALALGKIDADEGLDLVLGNQNASNMLFRNDGGVLTTEPVWSSNPPAFTSAVALGDVNGDAKLDLVCGNGFNSTTLYLNEGVVFSQNPIWSSADAPLTLSVALGDVDGNGSLDLVCGNSGFAVGSKTTLYRNDNGLFTVTPVWSSGPVGFTQSVALGDIDDDGDLDLVCGNGRPFAPEGNITIFEGRRAPPYRGNPLRPANQLPFTTAYLRTVRTEPLGPNGLRVSLRALDLESDPVWILAEYQFEGDPIWRPVEVAEAGASLEPGRVGPLSTSPAGSSHSFEWDFTRVPNDGRNVVLRLRTVSWPRRVSVIQDIPIYVRTVGRLVPQRAEIATSADHLAFETVTVGDTVSVTLWISNRGNRDLVVTELALPSPEMQIDQTFPLRCGPGESIPVRVSLAPRRETAVSGALRIRSNDPVTPEKTIALSGDIRLLQISSRLLSPGAELPLGEAVTVIVTPTPQVRIERGFLFHRAAGRGPGFPDSIPLGRSAGDFIGVIPGSAVREAGLEYFIRVENSGLRASDPPGAPGAFFTRQVGAPKEVRSSPSPNSGTGFLENRPIRVEIGLPQGVEFLSGFLHYRRGGERTYGTQELSSASAYPVGTIPDSVCTAAGVEYWVEVETLTRTLTDPPQTPLEQPRRISITVPNLIEPRSHQGMVYRMFSIPLVFDDEFTGTIAALLSDQDEFGPYDQTQWRAFRYRPGPADYQELGQEGTDEEFRPIPGRAFWLVARQENRIATAPMRGFSVPTDSMYVIRLQPGWNQAGNPFTFPVAWGLTEVDTLGSVENNPDRLEPVVEWSGGEYRSDVRRLEPFQGYWVKNLTGAELLWKIPARSDSLSSRSWADAAPAPDRMNGGNRKSEPEGPPGGDSQTGPGKIDWGILLCARVQGARDRAHLAGVRADASPQWDRYDRSDPPAAPGRSLSLRFPHGDWPSHGGDYAVDIRGGPELGDGGTAPAGLPQTDWGWSWDLELTLNAQPDDARSGRFSEGAEDAVLEFRLVGALPSGARTCLVDRVLQQSIFVQETGEYRFSLPPPDSGRAASVPRFALLIGDEAFLGRTLSSLAGIPLHTKLWPASPNPAGASILIRYDLARPSRVTLSVFDVAGSLVRALAQEPRPAGRHQAVWDGADGAGRKVASGVYYIRLATSGVQLCRSMVWVR